MRSLTDFISGRIVAHKERLTALEAIVEKEMQKKIFQRRMRLLELVEREILKCNCALRELEAILCAQSSNETEG